MTDSATPESLPAIEPTPGSDFWKLKDDSLWVGTLIHEKIAALGISESFLTGDTSYTVGSAYAEVQQAYEELVREARDGLTSPYLAKLVRRLMRVAHKSLHAEQTAQRKRLNKRKKQRRHRCGRRS